jgi:hypothetical protein
MASPMEEGTVLIYSHIDLCLYILSNGQRSTSLHIFSCFFWSFYLLIHLLCLLIWWYEKVMYFAAKFSSNRNKDLIFLVLCDFPLSQRDFWIFPWSIYLFSLFEIHINILLNSSLYLPDFEGNGTRKIGLLNSNRILHPRI